MTFGLRCWVVAVEVVSASMRFFLVRVRWRSMVYLNVRTFTGLQRPNADDWRTRNPSESTSVDIQTLVSTQQ